MALSLWKTVAQTPEQSLEKKIEDVKVSDQGGSLNEGSYNMNFSIDDVKYQVLRGDFPPLNEQQQQDCTIVLTLPASYKEAVDQAVERPNNAEDLIAAAVKVTVASFTSDKPI